jgi:phosphoglycerate kinase
MTWKTLDDIELRGKTVLTRVDINVPVENGTVTDATRIERIVPTINDIIDLGGKPVLLAHFGRPKGEYVPEMSLEVTIPALEAALRRKVTFGADTGEKSAREWIAEMNDGDILLLENVRFYAGEEKNDPAFARKIADLGDVFCNDAFSAAHRAHASTVGIAKLLPNCAGRLMELELNALETALGSPKRPVTAIVGGAKISTKLDLLSNLIDNVDNIIVGGGMANTFMLAKGQEIGTSLCERDMVDTAKHIMKTAVAKDTNIVLPSDVVIASRFEAGAPSTTVDADNCPADQMILDAGPNSVQEIWEVFGNSATLVWNGPLGAFEIPPFNAATDAAAMRAAELTRNAQLLSVAGGGDTVAALNNSGASSDFTYISTAGGAFLEWLEGKTLPAIAALEI